MKTLASAILIVLLAKNSFSVSPETVKNNNQFAFELYNKLDKKDKNIFLSPYSISTALAMTFTGAKSKTAECMEKVMHFSGGIENVSAEFNSLITEINSRNGKDIEINVANRLFGDKKTEFLDSFLQNVEKKFSAPLQKVDFKNDLEGSRKIINKWVEDKTKDKIKELIKKDVLSPGTKLALVNAIYFYGDWQHQFDSSSTRKGNFYTDEQSKKEVKMMWQKKHFEYMENSEMKAIRMPYKGNTISMEVYLPNKKDGITELEKNMTIDNYSKWSKEFKQENVSVTFPKYKMTVDFQLGDILKEMGMELAFSDYADFSGMSVKTPLKISHVIHKAFIDVSEKGTEAAAATAVIMVVTDSYHAPEPEKIFTADHPFFFTIRDNITGSILFMGKVVDPL